MHEKALMDDVMAKILEVADAEGGGRVKRVRVHLGALSHFTPEHFREHFDDAARGTAAEGAEVEAAVGTGPRRSARRRSGSGERRGRGGFLGARGELGLPLRVGVPQVWVMRPLEHETGMQMWPLPELQEELLQAGVRGAVPPPLVEPPPAPVDVVPDRVEAGEQPLVQGARLPVRDRDTCHETPPLWCRIPLQCRPGRGCPNRRLH